MPNAIRKRLCELIDGNKKLEAHLFVRSLRFVIRRPSNLDAQNQLKPVNVAMNSALEERIIMYSSHLYMYDSIGDGDVDEEEEVEVENEEEEHVVVDDDRKKKKQRKVIISKERIRECLNGIDGQFLSNAAYHFEDVGDRFSQFICMTHWLEIMGNAGKVANAYLRYLDNIFEISVDDIVNSEFTAYIFFQKLSKIFDSNDDTRQQFLSFVVQIYYVGQGVHKEPFAESNHRQRGLKEFLFEKINTRKEGCFTTQSGRKTVRIIETNMMWTLRELQVPIINLFYVSKHI